MKIFAIRDRMLDYYQRPVFSERAPDFVSAVANAINNGEANDFAKAPEHFEIWEIGEFNIETGEITAKQTILYNCASLIRERVREGGGASAVGPLERPTRGSEAAPEGRQGNGAAERGPIQDPARAAPSAPREAR